MHGRAVDVPPGRHGPRCDRTERDSRPPPPGAAGILRSMPFTVDKAELGLYSARLDREAAVDLEGALAWFGADEDGPTVQISRHDLQQFVHYTLPRKYLAGV